MADGSRRGDAAETKDEPDDDERLDEALQLTFPASDPPALSRDPRAPRTDDAHRPRS